MFKFTTDNKNVIFFLSQFFLRNISKRFSFTESREVFLNGNVYDFTVHYDSNDKSDVLNFHKHLMSKNNLKYV